MEGFVRVREEVCVEGKRGARIGKARDRKVGGEV